jgi:hypothetical protein
VVSVGAGFGVYVFDGFSSIFSSSSLEIVLILIKVWKVRRYGARFKRRPLEGCFLPSFLSLY